MDVSNIQDKIKKYKEIKVSCTDLASYSFMYENGVLVIWLSQHYLSVSGSVTFVVKDRTALIFPGLTIKFFSRIVTIVTSGV